MSSLRNLDLNLLVVFETLLHERHVTRAAEALNLSQSATSHALNRLRLQFDDPILVRTDQGMQPTPRAMAMLPAVQQALKLVERTLAPPERFNPATSERTFVIASTDFFEAVVLPPLVAELQQNAPGICIEIELIDQRTLADRLSTQRVDLVVGLDAGHDVPAYLLSQHWLSQPQVCLVGGNNGQVGDQLSLAQYLAQPHVVFADLSGAQTGNQTGAIDRWLAEQGCSRRYIAKNLNYIAAASIVAQSDAIITLPQPMAQLFCQMLPVRLVQPPVGMPTVEMTLIQHPFFSRSPSNRWLVDQVVEQGQRIG